MTAARTTSPRTPRYRLIAEQIRRQLESGDLASGAMLPSESELSESFAVSRVTIRRALEQLRVSGLVDSRQGLGWFVTPQPFHQQLGQLSTLQEQLNSAGMTSTREILSFGFVNAPAFVAAALNERTVLEVRRVNFADHLPIAVVTVWCQEALGATLSRADVERTSLLDQLGVRIGGATQRISANSADEETAALLHIPLHAPVLVAQRVTRDISGTAILVSRHVFASHLTEFVVELDAGVDAINPEGVQLRNSH